MKNETVTQVFTDALASAIPAAALTVSAWAETFRYLSPERSARPGRWHNNVVPYLRGIMDAATTPEVSEVVLVKSSQVAGTEALNNIIGYYIHIDPSPILYVCESEFKAEAWSSESLAPMIRDTPALAALVAEPKNRDSGNKITSKKFPGGRLSIAWATSPATLSSRPCRIVLFDEVDGFAPTKEGDAVGLGEARTKTFSNRKVFKISSPRNRTPLNPDDPDSPKLSPIERAYMLTDQRKFYVPCPHCGEFQTLTWGHVQWEADAPHEAWYACVSGCLIEHEDKAEMLARGEWRAHAPFAGKVGYFINELCSPFSSWGEMATAFVAAKKDLSQLKVFVNTRLGEGWEERETVAEIQDLAERAEPAPALLPAAILCLTAGVDVQADRLECQIVGWGLDDEFWSVDYHVLPGDPQQKEVWTQLRDILTADVLHERTGLMRVGAVGVDTGYLPDMGYRFCRANAGRRFYALKGAHTQGLPIAPRAPSRAGKPPTKLYTIGTEAAKDFIHAALQVTEAGPGFAHFPNDYPEAWFRQLRAEKPINTFIGGRSVRKWVKIKASARNEALDTLVYALAAREIWRPRELRGGATTPLASVVAPADTPDVTATPKPSGRRRHNTPFGDFAANFGNFSVGGFQ